ncbi:MAG TPA: sodium:calcium antiporter [Caulobacteraceae bacterium]|nr:sodium:calcium antiporter [Caulobacteraceae bacterium]
MPLILTLIGLAGSAAAIYLACEYFVNGVEWVGHRFAMDQKATGALLAAFGTALPESIVTLVAVLGRDPARKDIGVGAALGGPLVLATVAYAAVGWSLLLTKRSLADSKAGDLRALSRDQTWFILLFLVKMGVGLVAFALKPWLGVLFLIAYGAYAFSLTRGGDGHTEGELEPLKLQPKAATPSIGAILGQTLGALAVVFVASQVFVDRMEALGHGLGLSSQFLALLLSPVATELPETLNAVIWIRQGKTRLALANISGAMMIQATVPTSLGLFFTPWMLSPALVAAGVATLLAMFTLLFGFRTGRINAKMLALMAAFYVAFVVAVVALHLI